MRNTLVLRHDMHTLYVTINRKNYRSLHKIYKTSDIIAPKILLGRKWTTDIHLMLKWSFEMHYKIVYIVTLTKEGKFA